MLEFDSRLSHTEVLKVYRYITNMVVIRKVCFSFTVDTGTNLQRSTKGGSQ